MSLSADQNYMGRKDAAGTYQLNLAKNGTTPLRTTKA